MTELANLTVAEADCLADCERRIERGLATFVEVGTALATIRDNRLYRAEFGTFEDYCQARWGFNDRRASQLILAAGLVSTFVETGLPAPANEGQARELARVPEEQRAEVWRQTVERTDGRPTAAAIRDTYQRTQTPATRPEPAPAPRIEDTSQSACVDVPAGAGHHTPARQESEPVGGSRFARPDGPGHAPVSRTGDPADARPVTAPQPTEPRAATEADDAFRGASPAGEPAGPAALQSPPARPTFAEVLDRLVPDPNPHREWQGHFLKAISRAYRLMLYAPADVAEKADQQCIDELERVADQLATWRAEVMQARRTALPHNVTPLRRIS